MLSVLRTFGRTAHSHCPHEIRADRAQLTRTFSRKPAKGKFGGSRSRRSNADGAAEAGSTAGPTVGQLLLKPSLFAVGTGTCAFSAAAIYKYEDYVYQHEKQLREFQSFSSRVQRFLEGSDVGRSEWRQRLSQYWTRLSVGEKMALGCVWLNVCVFAGWKSRLPVVQQIMYRYFTASVYGPSPCLSMLLSTFSHTNLTHLAVNMICLWSFAPTVVNLLGKEQAAALYVSAGMSSSLASYLLNALRATTTVSVGASGQRILIKGFDRGVVMK